MSKTETYYLEGFKEKKVRVYLRNGFQISGHLKEFDNDVLIIITSEDELQTSKTKIIYKQNVSTIELA